MKILKWMGLLFVLLSFSNCTQKERFNEPVQPLYARAATYQLGSYYVFRDSVTHGLDSFYVTLCDTSKFLANDTWKETLITTFKDNANNEFGFVAGTVRYINFGFSKFAGTSNLSGGFIYGHDVTVGQMEENVGYYSNKCIQIHDSITIENRVYYHVYETLFQNYTTVDTAYLHKWYSLQDGLIKMRIHGNGVDKVYTTLRHLQLN